MSEETRPGASFVAVTKSDTVNLTRGPCRALYIGVSGDVAVLAPDGTTATFLSVPIGVLPVKALRVNSTGTTATNVIALY